MPNPPTRRATPRTISTLAALAASAVLAGCGTGAAPAGDASTGVPERASTPAATAPALSSAYGGPEVAGVIETDDVKESSGLSASECQDVLWTHNDSGSDALITP